MDVYLLNLDRATERLARMSERLKGVPFIRVEAIDGTNEPGNGFLSGPQIGCLSSHIKAWKCLVESGARHACILEDDVFLGPDFARMMKDDGWLPDEFDIVKIETMLVRTQLGPALASLDGYELRRLQSPHLGAGGYIISSSAVERALAIVEEFTSVVDNALFGEKGSSLQIFQVSPALCVQEHVVTGANTDSAIKPEGYRRPKVKRNLLEKFKREALRLPGSFGKRERLGVRIPFAGEREIGVRLRRARDLRPHPGPSSIRT